ncbi:MAG: DUF1232 domain-containing protein [Candidatus Heimdallarchaeota archaeon]|nr:DUF1232 domain-containing protein [Candidatus Heimdallarchaeota archaeon]
MFQKIKERTKAHAKHWKGEILFMVELLKHERVPKLAKILVFILLSYIFSPFDIIPDFIPIFGHWDDLFMIPLTMWLVAKITPAEVIKEVRAMIELREDVALFTGWGPKIAAVSVLLLWMYISYLTLKLLGFDSHFPIG